MSHAIKVRGRLSDPRHIELDEPVNDLTGPVDVLVPEAERSERSSAARTLVGLCADLGPAPSDEARRAGGGAAAVVDGSGFSRRCRDNGLRERVDFQVRSACAPKKVAFRRPAR